MGRLKRATKSKFYKKKRQKKISLFFQKAFELHQQGKLPEAKRKYEKVLALSPNNSEALINIGLICHNLKQLNKALEYYQQALALAPQLGRLHYFYGNALNDSGHTKKAVTSYKEAISCGYDEPAPLFQLGIIHEKLGRFSIARDYFQKIPPVLLISSRLIII